ncbi:response regulator [Flavobacterium sp. TSSA_36]|uniref:response regulator n=1 Tax=Flavobacterium sp. TSSA_36 TaxID=3447669 RepID=UPI003F38701F
MLRNRIVLAFFLVIFSLCNLIASNKAAAQKALINQSKEANSYFRDNNFEKSLLLAREVLKKALQTKNNELVAASYNLIGCNYNEFSEFDKAIEYFNKSLHYAKIVANDTLQFKAFNNLGNVYCFSKKNYNKGIPFFKKAIFYCKKINNKNYQLFVSINMAWAYFENSDFEHGLPFLKYANANFVENGNESICTVFEMINGMYFNHLGNFKKASEHLQKSIKHGYIHNDLDDVSDAHNEYSKLLFKYGHYKEAYIHLKKYDDLINSIYEENKIIKASVAGLNVELDEYKRELTKFELIKEAQKQNLIKSKIIVVLFIIVFCILLILIYTLVRNNSYKRKINTELTIANNDLLIAKEKAEVASQMKSQFVSTISHELRTPLYGVIGITNMLVDEYKYLAKSPHLTSLKFSARYLLSLINDILQINKIEENRIVLEHMTFNISDEIELIIQSLSFLAQNNRNRVEIDIHSNLPEYVIGDKLRFSQIIMNIVSNALKFTKNGNVKISAVVEKKEGNICYIQFKISDTGVGIDVKDQLKIFDKFVQVGRNDTDYQGTGLGLSIVKRLLELFNSEVHLESVIGQGTTFTFTIPFESDLQKTNAIINNINVDLSTSHIFKVLIVEDNKINQMVTRKLMEKNHFKCHVVEDGFQALSVLEKETFDIILMDINMPLMNGFETTRLIRSQQIETPIVALTAFDKEEIAEEALAAGLDDIIIKPFDQSKLFKVIHSLVSNSQSVS